MASTITRRGAARSRRDARVGEVEQEGAEDVREAGGQPDRAVEGAEDAAQQTRGGALARDPSPEPLAAAPADPGGRPALADCGGLRDINGDYGNYSAGGRAA